MIEILISPLISADSYRFADRILDKQLSQGCFVARINARDKAFLSLRVPAEDITEMW